VKLLQLELRKILRAVPFTRLVRDKMADAGLLGTLWDLM
jgi:hypothetical protein